MMLKGRMIQRKVSDWNGTNYTLTSTSKFVYEGEGWNIVAELNATNALVRSYVWGNDLSGSAQGAGGVGGLLMIRDVATGTSHHVCYDGNGNIVALVDAATKEVSAEYEYDPFGNCIKAAGPMGKVNPFRFSSKYVDDRTGYFYYGYRWYEPSTGRWLSRDPIAEQGGLNVYGFVGNASINTIDSLGLIHVILKYVTHIDTPTVKFPNLPFVGRTFNGGVKTSQTVNVDTDTKALTNTKSIGTTIEYNSIGAIIRTGTASGSTIVASVIGGSSDTKFKVKMSGNESNPLVRGAPGITYEVTITFEKCGTGRWKVSWDGKHDKYPSHDFYVKGNLFHHFSHIAAGTNLGYLYFPLWAGESFAGFTIAK